MAMLMTGISIFQNHQLARKLQMPRGTRAVGWVNLHLLTKMKWFFLPRTRSTELVDIFTATHYFKVKRISFAFFKKSCRRGSINYSSFIRCVACCTPHHVKHSCCSSHHDFSVVWFSFHVILFIRSAQKSIFNNYSRTFYKTYCTHTECLLRNPLFIQYTQTRRCI
jgi:hypothetical protein